MGKHSKRPKNQTDLTNEMDMVSSSEMTGAIPAQLSTEEQAEVFSEVFGLPRQKPTDQ